MTDTYRNGQTFPTTAEGLSGDERAEWFDAVGYRDRDTLYKLYVERGIPPGEIATMYGVAKSTVSDWIDRHEFERPPHDVETWNAHRRRVLAGLGIDPDS